MSRGKFNPQPTSIALACLGVLQSPQIAFAHEKWFIDAQGHDTAWRAMWQMPHLLAIGGVLIVTALAALWWRRRGKTDLIPGPQALGATEHGRVRFYALVPAILGIHVGLPLIVMGIRGELFSPNNRLAGTPMYWIGVAEIGFGLSFLYGGLTRLAAAGLGLLWIAGIALVGLEAMLENLHYLGYALFFLLAGRGPFAIDRLLFPALEPTPLQSGYAMPGLRVGTALGLVVVAFTEKLANPELAKAFLREHPLNFTAWLGWPMSDDAFILCAGATELLIGLCLVFGLFPRVVIATAWLFINMTLTIFNWEELLGHLPLYGVMAVLLVWTPREEDQRLWRRGLLDADSSR